MMLVSMSPFKLTDLSLTENVRKVVNSTKKVPKMRHGISIVLITVVFNSCKFNWIINISIKDLPI